jgi:hypothetical protein
VTAGGLAGGPPPGWLDVRASAGVAGRFLALELELHRRLGELAGTEQEPARRSFLAAASMGHAWRASLFEPLLPVSVGLPGREELVVLPPAELQRLQAAGPEALLDEVYPQLVREYEATAALVPPASDGPLALAAARAAADLRRMLPEGTGQRTSDAANLLRGPI